jgi:hypothetical protein
VKVYPKIPRYDHPVVPEDYFETEDLVLLEKFDGSSFRFTLYDERYANVYPDLVIEHADGDGSLVFGTRKSIRGSHRDELSDIDGALHRAVRCLREGVDTETLRGLHDEYGCPLVVYAENMVYSTLDYGYTEREIPALVGFDVLPYDAIEQVQPYGNPYEETHEGFLDVDSALEVLDRIRVVDAPREHALVPATVIDRPGSAFDPESYEFPTSSLAEDVRVEGVVVHGDSRERRVKVVREAFEERNREQFGTQPGAADSGAEYVVAKYCTPARIRSQVRRMVVDEGREFGLRLNDGLHRRVVEDMWAENWPELMEMDVEFTEYRGGCHGA